MRKRLALKKVGKRYWNNSIYSIQCYYFMIHYLRNIQDDRSSLFQNEHFHFSSAIDSGYSHPSVPVSESLHQQYQLPEWSFHHHRIVRLTRCTVIDCSWRQTATSIIPVLYINNWFSFRAHNIVFRISFRDQLTWFARKSGQYHLGSKRPPFPVSLRYNSLMLVSGCVDNIFHGQVGISRNKGYRLRNSVFGTTFTCIFINMQRHLQGLETGWKLFLQYRFSGGDSYSAWVLLSPDHTISRIIRIIQIFPMISLFIIKWSFDVATIPPPFQQTS